MTFAQGTDSRVRQMSFPPFSEAAERLNGLQLRERPSFVEMTCFGADVEWGER